MPIPTFNKTLVIDPAKSLVTVASTVSKELDFYIRDRLWLSISEIHQRLPKMIAFDL